MSDDPGKITPTQLRWLPFKMPETVGIDFVEGLHTIGTAGKYDVLLSVTPASTAIADPQAYR